MQAAGTPALWQIKRIFGRQFVGIAKERHHAKPAPAGVMFNHAIPIIKQCRIAAKFVDDEPCDHRVIASLQHSLRANDLGNHSAAINITDQHHRHIGGAGKSHIGDVTKPQIDLGRAARTFHNHQIVVRLQPVKAVQHRRHQTGLQRRIIARLYRGHPLPLHDHL